MLVAGGFGNFLSLDIMAGLADGIGMQSLDIVDELDVGGDELPSCRDILIGPLPPFYGLGEPAADSIADEF